MYPRETGYFRPSNMEEALKFLDKETESRPLAGGQSLIPMMRYRLISPSYLVDITHLNMSHIKATGSELRIGATTRYAELLANNEVGKMAPLLHKTLMHVGDYQVRSMGTLGGSASNADPGSDSPAALMAMNAKFVLRSGGGNREVAAKDFFKGPFTTDLKQGELLEEIVIPTHSDYKTNYMKLVRRAGDYAIVSVALMLKMKGDSVEDVRLAYANASDRPYRAREAEDFLRGKKLTDDNVREAGEIASKHSSPPSDIRGSSEYRRELIKLVTMKALRGMA